MKNTASTLCYLRGQFLADFISKPANILSNFLLILYLQTLEDDTMPNVSVSSPRKFRNSAELHILFLTVIENLFLCSCSKNNISLKCRKGGTFQINTFTKHLWMFTSRQLFPNEKFCIMECASDLLKISWNKLEFLLRYMRRSPFNKYWRVVDMQYFTDAKIKCRQCCAFTARSSHFMRARSWIFDSCCKTLY